MEDKPNKYERTTFTVPGRPVPKKNNPVIVQHAKHPVLLPSKAWRAYEKAALAYLRVKVHARLSGPVQVTALYWLPDRRWWPDLANLFEGTGDLLQAAGIIANDRDIVSWDGSRIMGLDPDTPRAEITVQAMAGT